MDEDRSEGEGEAGPAPLIKKLKTKPEKTIRRKQLKAKSKLIHDQIKKRKQFKNKKPSKK